MEDKSKNNDVLNVPAIERLLQNMDSYKIIVTSEMFDDPEKFEDIKARIGRIIDMMINSEAAKGEDTEESLINAMFSAYKTQVHQKDGKKYINEQIHEMFIKKHPPFKEFLDQYNGKKREEELRKALFEAKRRDEGEER